MYNQDWGDVNKYQRESSLVEGILQQYKGQSYIDLNIQTRRNHDAPI